MVQQYFDISISFPQGICGRQLRHICFALLVVFGNLSVAAPKYPEPIFSKRDIQKADANIDDINIRKLPIEEYPLLAKFTKLKRIRLDCQDGPWTTDAKLKLLPRLEFTNLFEITVLNCRSVTDDGIRALVSIPTLRNFQLEGTQITDKAVDAIVRNLKVSGISVANCPGVTFEGLRSLAQSETLQEITFSADNVTSDQVLELIRMFRNVKWCMIVDPQGRLDAHSIKVAASERKIHINIRPIGARPPRK